MGADNLLDIARECGIHKGAFYILVVVLSWKFFYLGQIYDSIMKENAYSRVRLFHDKLAIDNINKCIGHAFFSWILHITTLWYS